MKDKDGTRFVINDDDVTIGINGDTLRRNQLAHADAVEVFAVRTVDRDPLVIRVRHEQVLMQRDSHVNGLLELTRLPTADAELELVIAAAVGEDLHRLVVGVSDGDTTVGEHAKTLERSREGN